VSGAPVTAADHQLAHDLATQAGERLLEVRARLGVDVDDAKALKDLGDQTSHELLAAALADQRPGDAVLSEEGKADAAHLSAARTWIIDPLDGTREFSEPPRDDWAVHVSLVVEQTVVAAAVALPAAGTTLSTACPPPAPPASDGPIRILVSRTRPPALAE